MTDVDQQNEENIPIDPKTGKPLAGKLLKKWRREQKVKSDPNQAARAQEFASKNKPAESAPVVAKEAEVKQKPEEKPKNENETDEKEENIPIDPKTGKPIAGKLLKKWRREQLVKNNAEKSASAQEFGGNKPAQTEKTTQKPVQNVTTTQNAKQTKQNNSESAPSPRPTKKITDSTQALSPNQKSKNDRFYDDIFKHIIKEFEYNDDLQKTMSAAIDRNSPRVNQAIYNKQFPIGLNFPNNMKKEDACNNIHPAFQKFGLEMADSKRFFSCNQESSIEFCKCLISYVQTVDLTYGASNTMYSDKRSFLEAMGKDLETQFWFLEQCTTLGMALENIKKRIKRTEGTNRFNGEGNFILNEEVQAKNAALDVSSRQDVLQELRQLIVDRITEFIQGRIILPMEHIQKNASRRIFANLQKDDFIIIYKSDSLILNSLIKHLDNPVNKKVRIWVVDDLSDPEGCFSYRRLKEIENEDETLTMKIYYSPISSINHIFKKCCVKNVLIGCEGILQNGSVLAHAGTAIIATMAKMHNVPVVVFCESYKFHEDIQTDSVKKNAIVSRVVDLFLGVWLGFVI